MSLNFLRFGALALASALLRPALATAQDEPTGVARRLAGVLAIAADEYARGLSGGQIASAEELHEAQLLIDEAQRLGQLLPPSVRARVAIALGHLGDLAAGEAEPAELQAAVDSVRIALARKLRIALEPMPQRAPSLAAGAAVYAARCASCHGLDGSGSGPAAAGLSPPPANLAERAALADATPLDFFRRIGNGVAGTAMPGFERTLSVEERWAVALYASGLRFSDAERADGRRWLGRACADCLVFLAHAANSLDASDDSLTDALATIYGERPLASAVAYARTAAGLEELGGDRLLAVRGATRRADSLVQAAAAFARAGQWAAAAGHVTDAYLAFEPIERDVGARSRRAVHAVEMAFAGLRSAVAVQSGERADRAAGRARAALGTSARAVARTGSVTLAFGQSLLIILREGIEAILIISALIALLHKAGASERVAQIGTGAAAAVAASIVTAGLFATLVRVSAAKQEALEGVTLLVASAVLFSAASWLVSKIEAERWMAFVSAQMHGALRSGRALALAGVAFLAVYREGVETVLFYGALFGATDSAAGHVAVAAGLAAGSGVLAVVFVAIQRYGLRIPLRPFFGVTGALLTVMAVSFAGQGVAELQAAGWVPATPLDLPALPALGVFPTVQTLAAQIVVAGAFLAALGWIFWLSPRPMVRRWGS